MTFRFYILLSVLIGVTLGGCGVDRAPWAGPVAVDSSVDHRGGDALPDAVDLLGADQLPEVTNPPEIIDSAPELVEVVQDLGVEVIDVSDAGEDVSDLIDGEICTPDCEGKECGADYCGGVCGACPDNKPFCNMAFKCEACEADCGDKDCGSDGCGGSCGACPLGWGCVAGSCDPPQCTSDTILFEEDFLLCNEGAIAIFDDQPDDPVTWIVMEEGALSPPCALHFGDPISGSYDTGDPVSAMLVLPWLDVPSDGDPYLIEFAVRMDAEPVIAPEYPYDHDVLYLRAYGETLPQAGVVLFHSKEFLNNTGGAWKLAAASLDAYAGTSLQLRFEFDTIDSADNGYAGIWIDDLRVGTACPLCFDGEDCVDAEPCSEDICVIYSNQDEFGSCGHMPKELCCADLDPSFCEDFDPCTVDACDPVAGECTHEPIEECAP